MSIEYESAIQSARPVAISVEEAANLLGIGRTVAYQLVLGGCLRSIKIGRRRLVIRASIDEYVARLEASDQELHGT